MQSISLTTVGVLDVNAANIARSTNLYIMCWSLSTIVDLFMENDWTTYICTHVHLEFTLHPQVCCVWHTYDILTIFVLYPQVCTYLHHVVSSGWLWKIHNVLFEIVFVAGRSCEFSFEVLIQILHQGCTYFRKYPIMCRWRTIFKIHIRRMRIHCFKEYDVHCF